MQSNTRFWLLSAAVVVAMIAGVVWLMNRPYGETSSEGYQYAMALLSACNQQDAARLEKISAMMEESLRQGELQPTEAKWLTAIIDDAHAGDWDTASREVRRLMEDQLRPAPALPAAE
ncbi:MAG: hypothetical protein KY475_25790 [Planctomycetes bacterium]|nr:hypothetical protein [Planctomycetota bacterium]